MAWSHVRTESYLKNLDGPTTEASVYVSIMLVHWP